MNIPLKTLLIFCLVATTTAQTSTETSTSTDEATTVTAASTETSTSTDAATTVTAASTETSTSTDAATTVTAASTETSTSTDAATTVTAASTETSTSTDAATTVTTASTETSTSTDEATTVTAASTETSTSTDEATTVTAASTETSTSTDAATTVTAVSTETSPSTDEASTVTTASQETTTDTINTDTTTDSTANTPTSTSSTTTTTTTPGPCDLSPCIGDSTCEERFGGSFVCTCRPGLVYMNMTGCIETKVFPGSLSLNRDFKTGMDDRTSQVFQETAAEIEEALRKVLKGDGYVNSVVLSLRAGSIIAEVQNFYDLSSSATSDSVKDLIANGNIEDFEGFTTRSLCEDNFCDSTTTDCKEENGITECTCKKEYIKSQLTNKVCLACPNGERAVDSERCQKCSFGFTGFNCNDPYLLVVVVVSTVLGALLIIFIVALIVVSCRNGKESSSPQVDFSSSYGNKELHKPTGVPRIPRANPDAGWKSNSLEMTDSGSNQALVTRNRPESKARYTDYDDDMSSRGQIPPAYSGYGRGVENGGVHNPYFRQDDDRMRRY